MTKNPQMIDFVNYGLHLIALGIVTGLVVAVVRRIRRAR
jgi:hypothetical protein